MNNINDSGDWKEYQRLVLNELERHNTLLEKMDEKISKINTEIATLKVKSGLWGMAGAAVPIGIAIALKLINFE